MKECTIDAAIFEGVQKINNRSLTNNLHTGRLANDFSSLEGYSGAIAMLGDDGQYQLTKISRPDVKIPDLSLDQLWDCAKDHYGLAAISVSAGIGGMPVPKSMLGYRPLLRSSENTNLVSHFGHKFFPMAKVPTNFRKSAKATFGSVRIFGVIGRALPFVAVGFAIYDVVSIGMCALEARDGK